MFTYIRQMTPALRRYVAFSTVEDACALVSEDALRGDDYPRPYALTVDGLVLKGEAFARLVHKRGFAGRAERFGRGPDWVTLRFARMSHDNSEGAIQMESFTRAVELATSYLFSPVMTPLTIEVTGADGYLSYFGEDLEAVMHARIHAQALAKGLVE